MVELGPMQSFNFWISFCFTNETNNEAELGNISPDISIPDS